MNFFIKLSRIVAKLYKQSFSDFTSFFRISPSNWTEDGLILELKIFTFEFFESLFCLFLSLLQVLHRER